MFTRSVTSILDDDHYRTLQLALVLRPEQGTLIRGSGGLRKLRCPLPGRGKRGSARVIYYWDRHTETFYMLFVYRKTEQGDLTPEQIRILGKIVNKEFK